MVSASAAEKEKGGNYLINKLEKATEGMELPATPAMESRLRSKSEGATMGASGRGKVTGRTPTAPRSASRGRTRSEGGDPKAQRRAKSAGIGRPSAKVPGKVTWTPAGAGQDAVEATTSDLQEVASASASERARPATATAAFGNASAQVVPPNREAVSIRSGPGQRPLTASMALRNAATPQAGRGFTVTYGAGAHVHTPVGGSAGGGDASTHERPATATVAPTMLYNVVYTPPPTGGPYQPVPAASRASTLSKAGGVPKSPLERMREKREARKATQAKGRGGGTGRAGRKAFQPEEKPPTPEELQAALAKKKASQIGEFAECMSNTRVTSAALSAPSYLHKPTHWFNN